jgi:transcriptional regulator with XRE-family HTH domain
VSAMTEVIIERTSVTIGKFIQQRREEKQISLRALATLCCVSESYLRRVEDDLQPPSKRLLDSAAFHLQCDGDALRLMGGFVPDDIVSLLQEKPVLCKLLRLVAS